MEYATRLDRMHALTDALADYLDSQSNDDLLWQAEALARLSDMGVTGEQLPVLCAAFA